MEVRQLNTLIREVTDNLESYELGVASAKIYDFIWDTYCDWYIELTKTRLNGEDAAAADAARKVLVYVLDKALKLLHAKTGAALARDVFGADDEIYNAILWHTTGKANMTLLEKVIYLADYIEPNRDFDGVEDLRKVVWEDLDKGLEMGLAMTVEEMEQMGNPVHHNTLQALEYLRGHTHE